MRLVRSRVIADATSYLEERGADPGAILGAVGLPPLAEGQKIVTLGVDVLWRWFEVAARESGDPLLGIHLGESSRRGNYGVIEFACRSAPNLREALVRVARYDKLLNGAVEITFEETATGGVLRHELPGEPLCVGRGGNEYTVALVIREIREVTERTDAIAWIAFAHPEPPEAAAVAELLGTNDIRYGAGLNALGFAPSMLELPIVTADAALLAYLEENADRDVATQSSPPTLPATLQRLIRERLAAAEPALSSTARELGMSVRTLQRRLADEATSYQDLVDDVRRELALAAVRDTEQPYNEIASSLGYSDIRPFLRAFKRWTGKTPTQVRTGDASA